MKKIVLPFAIYVCMTLVPDLRANEYDTNAGCVTNPPPLETMPYQQGSDAVSEELLEIQTIKSKRICPEYIANLVNVVRNGKLDVDKKVLAIYLLGELHPIDTNSVTVLIENIDLKAARIDPATRVRRWGQYPAQEALIKIGRPTVGLILQFLPAEAKELRRHIMCDALVQIEGWNKPVFNKGEGQKIVETQIKEKLASESDPARRTNLELALKELAK